MAKAQEIVGLDCFADAFESVAKVLRVRFDESISLREAALNSDNIEGVHDMRVAIRRLRSTLRDFSPYFKKRPIKKIQEDLKNLSNALGVVRDQDVAIATLQKLQEKSENITFKEGIEKFIAEYRNKRETSHFNLIETLTLSLIKDLQERFATALNNSINREKSACRISFKDAGREVISRNLDDFLNLSTNLYKPFNIKKLHKLRISTKRLRYACKLFTVCWSDQMSPFAKEISKMQSYLGEVHDYDVWIESLSQQLNEMNNDERQIGFRLLSKFIEERTTNYCTALQLWRNWQENNFIKRLQKVLQENT